MWRAPADDSPIVFLVMYRLRFALMAILALVLLSTVGYVVLENYGWIDALYMTVITLGTVGYGEIHPLDTVGRILTAVVIIIGFTTFVYAVSVLTNLFVSGEPLRLLHNRRSQRMRDALEHHVIVVGFGRVGQAVVRGLQELGRPCVVIDRNPDRHDEISAVGGIEMVGDATNEDDLRRAGIDRADALIAACDQDSENLVVVLTAKATRSDLRIVSRVNEATWVERIKHAGANVAQSPYPSYGMSLAAAATSHAVLDLHDLPLLGLGTEEIAVPADSHIVGISPAELAAAHPRVHIVGLRRDDRLHRWHEIDSTLQADDIIVALGTHEDLMTLLRDTTGVRDTPTLH